MEFLKRALIKDAEIHDDTVRNHETLEVMNLIGTIIRDKITNIEDSTLETMKSENTLLTIFIITEDDLVQAQGKYKAFTGKEIEGDNVKAFIYYVGLRFVECLKYTNAVESVEKLVSLVPPAVLHATDVNHLTTYFIFEVGEITEEFQRMMGSLESMMMKAIGFILDPISKVELFF